MILIDRGGRRQAKLAHILEQTEPADLDDNSAAISPESNVATPSPNASRSTGLGTLSKVETSVPSTHTSVKSVLSQNPPLEIYLSAIIKQNTVAALMSNMSLFGMTIGSICLEVTVSSVSMLLSPILLDVHKIPTCLQPTSLQRTRPHHPWIDLLPSPALRNRILDDSCMIDEKEFRRDIVGSGKSPINRGRPGFIVWGNATNVKDWEVAPWLAWKWKHILADCDDLMSATNFWRSIRGECALNLTGI